MQLTRMGVAAARCQLPIGDKSCCLLCSISLVPNSCLGEVLRSIAPLRFHQQLQYLSIAHPRARFVAPAESLPVHYSQKNAPKASINQTTAAYLPDRSLSLFAPSTTKWIPVQQTTLLPRYATCLHTMTTDADLPEEFHGPRQETASRPVR